MEKRFYAGLRLQEDLDLCNMYDQIVNDKRFDIINHDRKYEIVEMKYIDNYSTNREPTGKTHIGFNFNYINVKYKDYIVNIETASYYPFTDDNNPGKINATLYKIVGENKRHQCSYRHAITCPQDIINLIDGHNWQCFKGTQDQRIKW